MDSSDGTPQTKEHGSPLTFEFVVDRHMPTWGLLPGDRITILGADVTVIRRVGPNGQDPAQLLIDLAKEVEQGGSDARRQLRLLGT